MDEDGLCAGSGEDQVQREILASHEKSYTPMRMRRQSSTLRIVAGETSPHLDVRRSVEIERTSSHLIKLFSLTPPSGGSSGT